MTTLDYSLERRIQLSLEEAKAEGIQEGMQKGTSMLKDVFVRLKAGEAPAALAVDCQVKLTHFYV